jgi:hypothetical protein
VRIRPGLHRIAALAAAALLTACGGGLWLGFGGVWDDWPPSVSLAATASSVPAGGTLRVIAAAADESGIDEVAFYRLVDSGWVRLGSDGVEPYEWLVPVPADGRSSVSVFARATDGSGLQADSAIISVPVTP